MSQSSTVYSLSISPDGESLCVGLNDGFCVYSLNPFSETFRFSDNRSSSNAITLPSVSIVVYSGIHGQKSFSDKSICVYNYSTKRPTIQVDLPEKVHKIVMNTKMFIIALKSEVRLYNFEPAGLFSQLRCASNEYAPVDIVEYKGTSLIGMTGKQSCILRVVTSDSSEIVDLSIEAHSHPITHIKFSSNGSYVATASSQGTIIRVFNTLSGERIAEFRRGSFSADIQSIAFSPTSAHLAVTSSKNTLHIFSLEGDKTDVQRSIASWKIPDSGFSNVAFRSQDSIVMATSEGNIYLLRFDANTPAIHLEGSSPFLS